VRELDVKRENKNELNDNDHYNDILCVEALEKLEKYLNTKKQSSHGIMRYASKHTPRSGGQINGSREIFTVSR